MKTKVFSVVERWSGSLGQETGIYKCETALVFMPQPVSVALC